MMYSFGWYDLIPIPGLILALYAQFRMRRLYSEYQKVPQRQGMTGAEVARAILDHEGLRDVAIEPIEGELTDHYDPSHRVLRLSRSNFEISSLSSIGVAAHEAGHALQHKEKYAPLEARMAVVGMTNFATNSGVILFFIGMVFHSAWMLQLGVWLYSAIVVFQMITLPVEFDASARAKKVLSTLGFVRGDELIAIRKVLGAAALTYVAGLATAALELIRMIALSHAIRDREERG